MEVPGIVVTVDAGHEGADPEALLEPFTVGDRVQISSKALVGNLFPFNGRAT